LISYSLYDRLLELEETDWHELYKPFYDELIEAEKQSQEKSTSERITEAKPSHSVEAYLGRYEHPGYGIVSIERKEDALQMILNDKLGLTQSSENL